MFSQYILKKNLAAPVSRADRQTRAAEHRRSIIEMVAHDLRSPLMASQISIDMIQELFVELSDSGFEALQAAHRNLEITINSANGLLNYARDLANINAVNATGKLDFSPDSKTSAQLRSFPSLRIAQTLTFMAQEMNITLRNAAASLLRFESVDGQRIPNDVRLHLHRAMLGLERGLELINDQLRIEALISGSVCLAKSRCRVDELVNDAVSSLKGCR